MTPVVFLKYFADVVNYKSEMFWTYDRPNNEQSLQVNIFLNYPSANCEKLIGSLDLQRMPFEYGVVIICLTSSIEHTIFFIT